MSRTSSVFVLFMLSITVPLIAGCASGTKGTVTPYLSPSLSQSSRQGFKNGGLPTQPALISLDNQTGALEYWQIQPGGGQTPIMINAGIGIASEYGMAANGSVLAIASYSPSEVVTYDLAAQAKSVFPDPDGPPIDVAIAKGDTIFVLNSGSVTTYPEDRSAFRTLKCQYINEGVAIAVDNESNVFVNGYGPGGFLGVVEFLSHSKGCTALNLKPELGTVAGLGVDPQTDNLIVVDNPGSCSGTNNARMTVYSKPYGPKTGVRSSLSGLSCAGTFRFDATSSTMFIEGLTAGSVISQIDQFSYPGLDNEGSYGGSDPPGGMTTLPNALPN